MSGLELRLLGYGFAAVAGLGAWLWLADLRRDAASGRQAQRDLAVLQATVTERARHDADVQKGYQTELERLRAERARPARVIRVCDAAPAVPASGGPAGQSDDPGTGAGELPQAAGRDIGPALYAEADRADELAAQLRALQEWVRGE